MNFLVKKYPDLFKFIESDEVHLHDHLMNQMFLKFIPNRFTPNNITIIRLLLTPIVFFLILSDYYFVGTIVFLFAALTDAIDGSLARTRNQITKFGMLFDPLVDKLLIGSLVLILVFRYYNFWLGIGILGLEIAFILSALVWKYKFKTVKSANVWGKIKMILQVIALFLTLLALLLDHPSLLTVGAWTFGLAIGFAIVSLFSHGI